MAARPTPLIPPPATDLPLGEGRTLRVGAQLGRGAGATVYRGSIDGRFGMRRAVAVKVFDAIASDEHEKVLSALASAARRAACIRHPNVARVEDFGMLCPAQPYAVLELVEGRTLARLLGHATRRRERVPLDLALFVGLEIAEGLAGARLACSPEGVRLAVAHGELAATDVLLSWHGEVKVCDFGWGAASRAASGVRSATSAAWRLRAMAPEVARGKAGDARSDVFSLGVLLHEMLVGPRFPAFVSDPQALTLARDGVVHRGLFEPQPSPLVRTVLARALERDPALRYPHAGAMAYELRRAVLLMGVGDGRGFLRAAMVRAFGEDGASDDNESTGELKVPRPSGVGTIDRFARLRGDATPATPGEETPEAEEEGDALVPPPEGFQSGTQLAGGARIEEGEEDGGV